MLTHLRDHGIVVDNVGDGVDEADDLLGKEVALRRLTREDEGRRAQLKGGIIVDSLAQGHDLHDVEQLALVGVEAFDLDVKDHRGVKQELDGDPALVLADGDLHPGVEMVGEKRRYGGLTFRWQPTDAGGGFLLGGGVAEPDDLLGASDRETLRNDPFGEQFLRPLVGQPEQRARVPRGEHPGRHLRLHGGGEVQQPQDIGDLRTAAVNPLGEFLLGAVEVAQELLVGERFLQGVEVGAVQVLQERVAEERVVVGSSLINFFSLYYFF